LKSISVNRRFKKFS